MKSEFAASSELRQDSAKSILVYMTLKCDYSVNSGIERVGIQPIPVVVEMAIRQQNCCGLS